MEICLAILLAAWKAGILAGGDGKDGTHSYTVINARDPINIVIRPTGRATISTVQSDQEHNFILEDNDDHVDLFVKLSEMLIEENLDTQANKLLTIIKGQARLADEDVMDEEFPEDEDGDESEDEPTDSNFDDDEDDEEPMTEEANAKMQISFRDPAFLDNFEKAMAAAATTPVVTTTVTVAEEAVTEEASSALMASCINVAKLSEMVNCNGFTKFEIMATLADQVGHHPAKAIFDALQAIHVHNGIMPMGLSEMADNWMSKLLGFVAETCGPMVLAEVRGTLISYLPLN